jgi:hypothetical protein
LSGGTAAWRGKTGRSPAARGEARSSRPKTFWTTEITPAGTKSVEAAPTAATATTTATSSAAAESTAIRPEPVRATRSELVRAKSFGTEPIKAAATAAAWTETARSVAWTVEAVVAGPSTTSAATTAASSASAEPARHAGTDRRAGVHACFHSLSGGDHLAELRLDQLPLLIAGMKPGFQGACGVGISGRGRSPFGGLSAGFCRGTIAATLRVSPRGRQSYQ